MWREAKSVLQNGHTSNKEAESKLNRQVIPGETRSLKSQRDKRNIKFNGCLKYIQYCAKVFSESCPTQSGISILPYESIPQFFKEYLNFHKTYGISVSTRANIDTFRDAFKSLSSSVRLVHSKGSFPTCDICNNANDLLRQNKVSFNPKFRDIVMKFKRAHLIRQMKVQGKNNYIIIRILRNDLIICMYRSESIWKSTSVAQGLR